MIREDNTTTRIKEQIDKLKTLSKLQDNISSTESDSFLMKKKMEITREEMLKCTYNVGKLLKQLEEKV